MAAHACWQLGEYFTTALRLFFSASAAPSKTNKKEAAGDPDHTKRTHCGAKLRFGPF
jgi:hypothetical protein